MNPAIFDKPSGAGALLGPGDIATPTAGYSLRYLSINYFGQPVVRVRKDVVGNPEQDFTPNQLTDGTLATFLGANDGFVSKWYDQFGSNDAEQATAAEQPKIWDASTGLVTENGRPAVDFDGVNDFMSVIGSLYSADINIFSVLKILTTTSIQPTYYQRIIHLADGTNTYQITRADDLNSYYLLTKNTDYNTGTDSFDWGNHEGQLLISARSNNSSDSDDVYVDSVAQVEGGNNIAIGGGNNSPSTFGSRNDNLASTYFEGTIQEIIIYNNDQSANRTKIEDNINDYYDIY